MEGGNATMRTSFKKFLNDEVGQTTTEYILILAIVVMIAVKFRSVFMAQLNQIISQVSSNIQSAAQQQ